MFLVFVLLLAATAAVAATSDSSSSSATVTPAIRTYLMPDLSLKTVLSLDMLPRLRPWRHSLMRRPPLPPSWDSASVVVVFDAARPPIAEAQLAGRSLPVAPQGAEL